MVVSRGDKLRGCLTDLYMVLVFGFGLVALILLNRYC